MRPPPDELESIRQWVARAEGDFHAAAHLLGTGKVEFNDAICFHAQQCAEKYLKVLLQLNSIDFPYTHDLRLLFELLPEGTRPKIGLADFIRLNRYAIQARYPGDWEPVSRREAEEAVTASRAMRDAARAIIPTDLIS
jgi:HEPN domain-containing protein